MSYGSDQSSCMHFLRLTMAVSNSAQLLSQRVEPPRVQVPKLAVFRSKPQLRPRLFDTQCTLVQPMVLSKHATLLPAREHYRLTYWDSRQQLSQWTVRHRKTLLGSLVTLNSDRHRPFESQRYPLTLFTDFFGSEGWGFESLRARQYPQTRSRLRIPANFLGPIPRTSSSSSTEPKAETRRR
jgi:hypothetical protein